MPQPITNLVIGAKVKDTNTKHFNQTITWLIGAKNHAGYPANSVTLITDKILCLKAFDAMETANADANRKQYGNNRYLHANLRQWLNSEAAAGAWYSAQHTADAPPSAANVNSGHNPYQAEAGFLHGFSADMRAALMPTTLTVARNTVTDGGGSETVNNKVFLASNTEVGLANENSIAEGTKLALFSDNNSRLAMPTAQAVSNSNYTASSFNTGQAWHWWLRTPYAADSHYARFVSSSGALDYNIAFGGSVGVRPLCNLPSEILVSDTVGGDGAYTIMWNQPPTITVDNPTPAGTALNTFTPGSIIKINESGVPQDYYVAKHDYENSGRTLLVRRYVYDQRQWHSSAVNAYATSTIDAWLNGAFLALLDSGDQAQISAVSIPYTPGNGNATVGTLSRKVFLLSVTELEKALYTNANTEGTTLSIADTLKIATDSIGAAQTQWTRSPHKSNTTNANTLMHTGGASNSNATDTRYSRPCFTLPATYLITDPNNIGTKESDFSLTYTVSDPDVGDVVTVEEAVNGVTIKTYTVTLDAPQTLNVAGLDFLKCLNGPNTLTITASDDGGSSATRTLTFTKSVTQMSITLDTPLPADDMPTKCNLSITREIPDGAIFAVEVCNNGNDAVPTWEDCTITVKNSRNHVFTNNQKTAADWGLNFRVAVDRNGAVGPCYVTGIGGFYE